MVEALAEGELLECLTHYCADDMIQALAYRLRACMEYIEDNGGAIYFE